MVRCSMAMAASCLALLVAAPVTAAPVCRAEQGYAADFDGRRTFRWKPRLQTH